MTKIILKCLKLLAFRLVEFVHPCEDGHKQFLINYFFSIVSNMTTDIKCYWNNRENVLDLFVWLSIRIEKDFHIEFIRMRLSYTDRI